MSLVEFISYGASKAELSSIIIYTLCMTHITIVAVTVFLHRCQAHRSLKLSPVISHFFRFWLWLTTGMVTKEWAAIHRKHHAKCEGKDDPHSPQVKGISKVLWHGTELYRETAKDQECIEKYGHGTPDDWLERHVYSKHTVWGVGSMLVINFCLFGIIGVAIWAIQMMWIPFFAAGVINGIAHFVGYRNFKTPDASRNISPIGILIGGEELHNNHHSHATSPKLSSKWYEFDIGWFYIKLFEFFGLAEIRSVPKDPIYNPAKNIIDEDTVEAILAAKYELFQKLHKLVHKLSLRYNKEKSLLSLSSETARREALASQLRLIISLRNDFEKIWHHQRTSSVEQIVVALQNWCKKAEKSGVTVLQEYSRSLRMLTVQN